MNVSLNKLLIIASGLFCAGQIVLSRGEISPLPLFLVLLFSAVQAGFDFFQVASVAKEDKEKLDAALLQLERDRTDFQNRLEHRIGNVENRLGMVGFSLDN